MIYTAEGSANHVYPDAVSTVLNYGMQVPSRLDKTLELHPALLEITDPSRPLITSYGRPVNPAFALAEVVWILTGREDVAMLKRYNSRIDEYSDDGEIFNAAYGARIRTEFGHDQLLDVIAQLIEQPDTRQAILQIWSPRKDLTYRRWRSSFGLSSTKHSTKDRACLAGDTLVWSPEGDMPISKVAHKFASGEISKWPVYSVNVESQKMEIQWATDVWLVGRKPTVKITFDDGSVLRTTDDHILFKKTRKKIMGDSSYRGSHVVLKETAAGNLRPGDRVLATARFFDTSGHEWHKRYLNINGRFSNRVRTHREYYELVHDEILEGNDVHHLNGVETDNRINNLVSLSHGDHAALKMMGQRNPMNNLTEAQHAVRSAKWRDTYRRHGHYADVRNHVVVSVEIAPTVNVYDFSVPYGHTAVVGTGVVVHNCNIVGHALIRDGWLDWTQFVRSNDIIWGTPNNFMQWMHVQQFVAGMVGVPVGSYYHFADSLHLYDYHRDEASLVSQFDLYDELGTDHRPMEASWSALNMVADFEESIRTGTDPTQVNPFGNRLDYWHQVGEIFRAWHWYKEREDDRAHATLINMRDPVLACAQARYFYWWRWHKDEYSQHAKSLQDWKVPDSVKSWLVAGHHVPKP